MAMRASLIAGKHLVAGDLLLDEAIVGLVVIEGADHVIAIAPGVRPVLIEFEAIGVGVANHVQPLRGPALAIMRRREQAIDYFFIRVGAWSFRNESSSSGVGGRPVRSYVTRRRS